MKTIRTYQNVGEAGFAHSLLESSGIDAALNHEASGTALPGGMAILLQVPAEQMADAERILADHPIRFTRSDDHPRVGFWRGGIFGLLALGAILLIIAACGGSWRLTWGSVGVIFLAGGLIGANLKTSKTQTPADAGSE